MSDSEQMQTLIERGLTRSRQDDWVGAAEAFRRAVHLDTTSVEPRFRLGWALWNYADYNKPTVADWGMGILAQVAGWEGMARDRTDKIKTYRKLLRESCHWFRETIARDAHHARAHYYLAKALKELDQKSEAMIMARRAAELEPHNTRYTTLVQTYAQANVQNALPFEASPPEARGAKRLSWNDIVLAPKTKRELRQMQLILENPAEAQELGIDPPTGILLKGPPGTGKTTVARVLASEAKCKFFTISPADINQMYVGESEKRVRDLFARARANAPAIIFVDEIDALMPSRQGGIAVHSDKVVNQFLQEMDGMTPNGRIMVVGATNRADMLDPAVRRGGRLSREIEIPLPEADARRQLLLLFTKGVKLADDVDFDTIIEKTKGYSGADIRAVVNEAGLQALVRFADEPDDVGARKERKLTMADFTEALTNIDQM